MKKLYFMLALSLIASLFFATGAFASEGEPNQSLQDSLRQIEDEYDVEFVDKEEVPAGTEFLEFDSIEEFKAFIESYQKATNSVQAVEHKESNVTTESSTIEPQLIRYHGSGTHNFLPIQGNPLKYQPSVMTLDYGYTASGYGVAKRFISIDAIGAFDNSLYSTWHNTIPPYSNVAASGSFADLTIRGYHLIGVSIQGFEIGYRESANYTERVYP